ncbi:GIY-YIG nuclease family protein [Chryseobacterium foetidum]|uniref:GIY-YIG nuclease family protein n=1 Tax=Chryseobacterium foetidum TaxID=2951057 RepID=UPI0021C6A6AC|nr:GIY-YIG nuclease family protein [Chryseobacterium foetidum]
MLLYYVYIVKCSDNSYYTGVTNDLERRINEHNDGNKPESYTYKRRLVELVFYYEFNDINQAIEFEKQVKGWSRKKKEAIINDNWEFPELVEGLLKKKISCTN